MTERRPICSAHAAGQQIGYIEDDLAFDLFDRPCAIYESNTGLLRDPENNAVVGYVSLTDIFVGSSRMLKELFSEARPVASQAKNTNVEEHTLHATDVTTFSNSSRQDEVIDSVLAPPSNPHLADFSTEQPARPQDASDAGKGFASGEPGSDEPSRPTGETGPTLQPDADADATTLAPSDERTFESAQPVEPSGGDGMPSAVEAFMRHLTEYLHSGDHQAATLSSDDAAQVKLSPSAEAQKEMDSTAFPREGEPSG
jgi:hypothetical protein